ncbi:MAG: response regulator [Woeseia sp.]|nr:response regulator [Woeseia sp.]
MTEWSGNAARYGFNNLTRGDNMQDSAPFLFGMLGETIVQLPLATLPRIGTVEVHIIPRQGEYAILLLSRFVDHSASQLQQQSVNENRLLQIQQQQLIRRQRDLIAELVETRGQLERQRQKAERASQAKGRFIAMMSHEFRTPLSSIISYADRLNEKDCDDEAIDHCGQSIARAARHLNELVNSVLDEARLDAGRQSLQLRPVNLRSLVDDLAAIIAPLAAEKGLSFSATVSDSVPAGVEIDDGCLRQVLLNLLGNAVKYTDEGKIHISLTWAAQELLATVQDDGPGIAPADQQRMFTAFERGAARKSSVQGTGLGLSISLRLTRLMKGTLTMDSDIGRGCRISVSIPARVVDLSEFDDQLALPEQDLHASKPAVILICDDDEDMRAIHEYYLTRAGYELLIAGDGKTALQLALERKPDLAVLDINTPGMSGIDVARRLREQNIEIPIVALTASDASRLDPGLFDERLRKPLQMNDLLKVLKSLLGQFS